MGRDRCWAGRGHRFPGHGAAGFDDGRWERFEGWDLVLLAKYMMQCPYRYTLQGPSGAYSDVEIVLMAA